MRYLLIFVLIVSMTIISLSCNNIPDKQKESRTGVMDSSAFCPKGLEVTPVNQAIDYNDTLGISLRPEYSVYSTKMEKIRFVLYNNSGKRITCGKRYYITYEDEKGIWKKLPINDAFEDIGYVVHNESSHFVEASLYPERHSNQAGRYRFYYTINIEERFITLREEFRLSNDEQELKQAVKCAPLLMSPRLANQNLKKNTEEKQDIIYSVVDEMPEFIGGMSQLFKFVNDNMQYPPIARENGIQGRIIVQVVIGKDGSVTDCSIAQSVDPSLDKEAIRIVNKMPKWRPGKQNGKVEKVKYFFPITFRITD